MWWIVYFCVWLLLFSVMGFFFFFFNDTATTEIYTFPYTTLFRSRGGGADLRCRCRRSGRRDHRGRTARDRKSTRLNSSHGYISYAVFCLKKKKTKKITKINTKKNTKT